MSVRICTVCGVENNGNNFHKGSPAKDGLQSKCKSCRNYSIVSNAKHYDVDESISGKVCSSCNQYLDISNFHVGTRNKDGLQEICKGCKQEYGFSTRRTPEFRAKRYGIDVSDMNQMLSNGCMVCGSHNKLVIDHDHSCCNKQNYSCGACVRGVLCDRCNIGLAHFEDSPEKLTRAAEYIRRNK